MGETGFNTYKAPETRYNRFTIAPVIGNFVSTNIVLGSAFGYLMETNKDETFNYFMIKPMIRYYWDITEDLYVFSQLTLPFTFGKGLSRYGVGLYPGIDYLLNDNWSVEVQLALMTLNFYKSKTDFL